MSTPPDLEQTPSSISVLSAICTENETHIRANSVSKATTIYYDSDPNYDVQFIKEKSLLQYSEELKEEYLEKIEQMQSLLNHVTQQNEAYESEITALKQEHQYLREASYQWHTRYNDTNLSLLNANEEIINLKKDLSDLQMLYHQSSNSMVLQHAANDGDDIQRTLKQYIDENARMKQDNGKYLNDLKQMNHECRETATKYDEITRDHMQLQKDLSASKSRVAELEKLVHESLAEISYLENQCDTLKYNLHEMSNKDWLDPLELDEKAIEIKKISYTPEPWPKRLRKRSLSRNSVFLESVCNSPIVRKSISDWNISSALADLFIDHQPLQERPQEEDHEAMEDLYEHMSHYLTQIQECVDMLRHIEHSYYKKTNHSRERIRRSSDSERIGRSKSMNEEWGERKKKESEPPSETLSGVIDTDKEEKLFTQITEIVEQCKENMTEIEKQQAIMITHERTKYADLNKMFQRHRAETVKNIKRLTLDVYRTQYKKYAGYRDIWREMVGNVGTYTKNCIVHKLTH